MIGKVFKPNLEGRDFVVGDLHGVLPVFEKMLKELAFDPAVDRMFSVGDLVDRGPNSIGALELLDNKWFHAVQGNHEQLMMDSIAEPSNSYLWEMNGGEWGAKDVKSYDNWQRGNGFIEGTAQSAKNLHRLSKKVAKLPFVISVKLKSGEVAHIVHAEFWESPADLSDKDILSRSKLAALFNKNTSAFSAADDQVLTWSRLRFGLFYGIDLSNTDKLLRIAKQNERLFKYPNLGRVISGHTVVQKPLSIGNFTNIDTGSFLIKEPGSYRGRDWAKITMLELNTWKFYSGDYETLNEVQPVVIAL